MTMTRQVLICVLGLMVALAQGQEPKQEEMEVDEYSGGEPQPAYSPQQQKAAYRYDENTAWNQEAQSAGPQAIAAQDWYRPVGAEAMHAGGGGGVNGGKHGGVAKHGGGNRNAAAQRRQDKKQQNRRQQNQQAPLRNAVQPQQFQGDFNYEDYDSEDSSLNILEYIPQPLRRAFNGFSSWMSRMDGSTVAAGALTAFALGVAAAMGTAGLSGVAFTGRKLVERFDLSWDKFKEIQKLDAVTRALDFLEIEDEICRQKAVCEVEQKVAMRNIFLWYTMRAVSGYIPGMDKYQEAAVMALEGHNCDEVYPQCPASVVERLGRLSWTDFLPNDGQVKKLAGLLSHKAKSMGVPTNLDDVARYLESNYGLVVKPDTMKSIARELVFHWTNRNTKH